MTTVTLPRATVEQALLVLESGLLVSHSSQVVTALRAALAQQDEPAREWVSMDEYKRLQGLVTSQGIRLMEYESKQPQQAEPVAWSGYDLDGMVEAFSRVIEAHHTSKHPFHDPIDTDARTALRILRGIIPAMKAVEETK